MLILPRMKRSRFIRHDTLCFSELHVFHAFFFLHAASDLLLLSLSVKCFIYIFASFIYNDIGLVISRRITYLRNDWRL